MIQSACGAKLQIIFEVSGDDAAFEPFLKKRRGPGLDRRGETRPNNPIAHFGAGKGQPALLLVERNFAWGDVQQRAPDAGIGDVRGDTRAHGAGAQNHNFFNRSF